MSLAKFDPNAPADPNAGIYGLPHTLEQSKVVLIPVPFEVTTSYGGGTSMGPMAIRSASAQVDLYDGETGKPYSSGIFMMEQAPKIVSSNKSARVRAKRVINGTDLERVNAACEQMNEIVQETTTALLQKHKLVGVIGGDHSVAFGSIEAHAKRYHKIGVLHVDAHADLREAYEGFVWSHASVMYNVLHRIADVRKLVQVGIRDFCEQEKREAEKWGRRVTMLRLSSSGSWQHLCQRLIEDLPEQVYISFDIDGLEPSLCPHTGTPVPGGLTWREAEELLSIVAENRAIVGFDLCEVAPGKSDEWDANVGARMLYKLIGYTLLSRHKHGSSLPR
jgi:agmatinase